MGQKVHHMVSGLFKAVEVAGAERDYDKQLTGREAEGELKKAQVAASVR
jgi:hypothetical protein